MPNKQKADRFNENKPKLSMILEARHALEGTALVLMFGAQKYDRGNWRKGLNHTEICDSLLRHLTDYLSGEDIDPESGLPHVDHIMCNALFLAEMFRTKPEMDDRSLKGDRSFKGDLGHGKIIIQDRPLNTYG